MPLYDYECENCGIFFDELIMMDDRLIPTKKPCPDCGAKKVKQVLLGMNIGDPVRLGIKKPSSEFNEVLTRISDANPRSKLHQKLSQGRRKKGTLD